MALWLAKSQNQQPIEIAQAIASHLLREGGDVFDVRIVPPGWIHLELTHSAIATWLQNVVLGNLGDSRTQPQQNHRVLFAVQHAHARCCSLVLLAQREGLIELGEPCHPSGFLGNLIHPNPIPWLDEQAKLHLNHLAESRLISELVQVVDDLASHTPTRVVNWEQVALSLSQAWENCWSQCRIWGEVKIHAPQLAQARLGLVIVTQSVLRFVLAEKLGVLPPLEL